MSTPIDISSLTSNSLATTAKNKLSSSSNNTKTTLLNRKDIITKKILDLENKSNNIIEEYKTKFIELEKNKKLSPEQKQKEFDNLQKKRDEEILFINNEINQLKNDISQTQLDDPLKDTKTNLNKFKLNKEKKKKRSREERNRANRDRTKAVLGNIAKNLAGVLSLLLTNQIINIVSDDSKLQELVDKTNAIIDAADTQQKINQARILRNNALTILNNQQRKIKNIQRIIQTLNTVIRIFSILLRVLSLIPIPPFAPSRISSRLIKIANLLDALSAILAIINPILQGIIDNIERLKAELKQIGDLLDNPSLIGLEGNNLRDAINLLRNPLGGDLGLILESYKGFRFEIRTEETLGASRAVVVKNIKRKYAVAIDKDGVVVVQSDYSFTQDPNDLIEQIKLIIDQRNLQT
jgi:hypothetical protein